MKNSMIHNDDEPNHPVFFSGENDVEDFDEVMMVDDNRRKHNSKSKRKGISSGNGAFRVSGPPPFAAGVSEKLQGTMDSMIHDDDEPDHPVFYSRNGGDVEEIDEVMSDIRRKHDSIRSNPPRTRNTQSRAVRVPGAPPSTLGESDKVQRAMNESETMTPGAVHHAPGQEPVRARPLARWSFYLSLLPRLRSRQTSKGPLDEGIDGDGSMNDRTTNTARASLGNNTQQDHVMESITEDQATLFRRNSSRLLSDMEARKRKQKCTRSMMWASIGLLIVIVCIAVGVSVGLSNSGGKTTNDNESPTNTEEMTSCHMQEYSDLNERFMELQSTIVSEFAGMRNSIESPGTSARAALCWMAYGDDFSSNSFNEEDADILVLGKPNASETLEILDLGVDGETIQRFALAVIYYHFAMTDSSTGSNKLMSTNWLSPVHICSWDYVHCYDALKTVFHLDLKLRKLTGSVPSELALLKTLATIELGFNLLTGSLPPELWSMPQLEEITLQQNLLTGTISHEIRKLSQLLYVTLTSNLFSGTVPDLSTLTSLKHLDISHNAFDGTIPSFEGCTSLVVLNIGGGVGVVEGSIPTELFLLTELGSIPTEVGTLTKLSDLQLASLTDITGTIPTEIGLLTDLQILNLGENTRLVGTVPTELGRLTNLQTLNLRTNTGLTGVIPLEVCSLVPALTELLSPWCFQNFCSCPN